MKIIRKDKKKINNKLLNKNFVILKKKIGILDIAFTVDNIADTLKYIVKNGGSIINKPLKSTLGFPALHCYSTDPEGNVLHLAQNLK